MPRFIGARYMANDLPPPAPQMVIRAVADDGAIWWLTDDCTQGDWLDYLAEGGTIEPYDPSFQLEAMP